jgi:hypothetical protein
MATIKIRSMVARYNWVKPDGTKTQLRQGDVVEVEKDDRIRLSLELGLIQVVEDADVKPVSK